MNPTTNFSVETDPKLACTCGHPKCDKRVVKQLVVNTLQRVREDYHAPIRVTSGGRCQYHPDEVNKEKEGEHQKCLAVDIWHDGTQAMVFKLCVLLGRHGATRIAVGKNFIHGGFMAVKSTRVPTWKYVKELKLT